MAGEISPGGREAQDPALCWKCRQAPGRHEVNTGEGIERVCCGCFDRMVRALLLTIEEIREAVR